MLIAAALLIAALVGTPSLAKAKGGFKVIRDVEIEALLHDITNRILDAAGISRGSVNLYIVQDKTLNAFVAGGLNLFVNTGLLMRTEHPGQLAGVIAHEVGHIAGGHLSRLGGAQERAARGRRPPTDTCLSARDWAAPAARPSGSRWVAR